MLDLAQLEQIAGHHFKDKQLLRCALTHSSVHNKDNDCNYERLEFFGDRVLGLVIAEMLFHRFPNASVRELCLRYNSLVNAKICARIAKECGLVEYIFLGSEMRSLDERRLLNIYADIIESFIAVLYIEGGIKAARQFINRFWQKEIENFSQLQQDPKTQLQEWSQGKTGQVPHYSVVARKGPDHAPHFTVKLELAGEDHVLGQGNSKREAECDAAKKFLQRLNFLPTQL